MCWPRSLNAGGLQHIAVHGVSVPTMTTNAFPSICRHRHPSPHWHGFAATAPPFIGSSSELCNVLSFSPQAVHEETLGGQVDAILFIQVRQGMRKAMSVRGLGVLQKGVPWRQRAAEDAKGHGATASSRLDDG